MEKYKPDVIVVPADQDIGNDLAAKMGFPAISVPLGFWPEGTPVQLDNKKPHLVKVAPGMPWADSYHPQWNVYWRLKRISLIFITKAFSDAVLLQVAYAFERLTAVRENGPLPFKIPVSEMACTQEKVGKL
jgi:amidase